MKELISIIIPTFNRAEIIKESIESILGQSYSNWELIIADDGSTDHTKEAILEYKSEKIKYINQKNSGAAKARNYGVEHASGDIITFLDSDDKATSDWLEKMIAPFEDKAVGVVCCGVSFKNNDGEVIKKRLPHDLGKILNNIKGRFTTGGVFMIRKPLFQAIGGYDNNQRSGQHTELSFRLVPFLIENNYQIHNINKCLIHQFLHVGERITTNPSSKLMGSIHTYNKHRRLFAKDKKLASNYLSVAAISAIKLDKVQTARKILFRALKLHFSFLLLTRLILTYLKPIREVLWKKNRVYQNPLKKIIFRR